jgi:LysR family hydrogen peroxide-inducible transcriptional activator
MPVTSLMGNENPESALLKYVPFKAPVPDRRVVLVWRKSFPRAAAVQALAQTIQQTDLPGTNRLPIDDTLFDASRA